MKLASLLTLTVISFSALADESLDYLKLRNNKESRSNLIETKNFSEIKEWIREYEIDEKALYQKSGLVLRDAIAEVRKNETICDYGFYKTFKQKAINYGYIRRTADLHPFLNYLRTRNFIDDVFLKMMRKLVDLNLVMIQTRADLTQSYSYPFTPNRNKNISVLELFDQISTMPDEKNSCVIDNLQSIQSSLTFTSESDKVKQTSFVLEEALDQKIIDLKYYNMLQLLNQNPDLVSGLKVRKYLAVVSKTKDIFLKGEPTKSKVNLTQNVISKKEMITERERLYRVYTPEQILMLSEVVNRTSQRISAKEANIVFTLQDDTNDNYKLTPLEQYRVSLRILQKEMNELKRSELFKENNIYYEDLVMSAFETGLISSSEFDQILKFEEFWNPSVPRWKAYTDFGFTIAQTATFLAPGPWNVVGAIALILTQSKIMAKDRQPEPVDNGNVVL